MTQGHIHTLPNPLPKRLNVGCGWDKREGYLNVDFQPFHAPDLVADVTNLPMLPGGYFDEIVAQDVLEHFERGKTDLALAEWARLLADGGTVHLRVPSLLHLPMMLGDPQNKTFEKANSIIHRLYGTQNYTGDYHLTSFTAETLEGHLRRAGLLVCHARLHHDWLFEVRARKTAQLTDPTELVHHAFFTILGRPVSDETSLQAHVAALRRGRTIEEVRQDIASSAEAEFLRRYPAYLLPYSSQFSLRAGLRRVAGRFLGRLTRKTNG